MENITAKCFKLIKVSVLLSWFKIKFASGDNIFTENCFKLIQVNILLSWF